ncbi:hypothetical protein JTB14_012625 [Gonioctena quinquepunctata]|nr:hypothetical protein JTB14_012625 [Gonioctena quinquepunctata]
MLRFLFFLGAILLVNSTSAVPVSSEDDSAKVNETSEATTIANNSSDEGVQDLYIIRSVVYEIGILTDADNDTDAGNKTHEQIDVSFFDPGENGTFADLSNIPFPIQTNVSGVSITGIIPANFGGINLLEDGTPTLNGSHFPLLPKKQVKVSHNVSTTNKDSSSSILGNLPDILGLQDLAKIGHKKDEEKEENRTEKSESS